MSSHYNLRSQHDTHMSADPTPDTQSESSISSVITDRTPTNLTSESNDSIVGSDLRPICSYSDMVRSRPNTPQPQVEKGLASIDNTIESPLNEATPVDDMQNKLSENPFTSESCDESDASWMTVECCRQKARKAGKNKSDLKGLHKTDLSLEQLSSLGEGPSKGKGIDPHNWGGIDIDDSDIDIHAQAEASKAWATARDWSKKKSDAQAEVSNNESDCEPEIRKLQDEFNEDSRSKKKDKPTRGPIDLMVKKVISKKSKKVVTRDTPPAMDAAAQIAPKSYLGRAFEQINASKKGRSSRKDNPSGPSHRIDDSSSSSTDKSSPSDSSSDPASLSSSSTTDDSSLEPSDSSSTNSYESTPTHKKRSSKKWKWSKSWKSARKKVTLKPIPPTKYDGSVDSRLFHRFITEGTAYIQDGNVPRSRQVFVLSHYLKDKAHDFYVRQVSDRPSGWRLSEFFTELFNYCFLLDFRTKQWNVPKREKVIKFWFGLNPNIQNELYKMCLNPEVSSLQRVQRTAEIIELANSTTESRSHHGDDGLKGPKGSMKGKSQTGATSRSSDNHANGAGQNDSPPEASRN
ncbi:hypothetical protein K503DRAFT_804946 [Rhizopogon vinicolor AM-OR11-026]|uniref:Uncharacterized protein n=1 Tax=Rhizopogon vinicolor AM-OR11-026 TaxID=1314800 RepID=A0A1B7MJL1_9AGAM|nr:hypothetical protein K503DRAFT_804946 [Rhizopogon vinicolor AM-OR11-026]